MGSGPTQAWQDPNRFSSPIGARPRNQLSQGNPLVKMFARQQGGSQFGGNEQSQDMLHRQLLQGQF